MDSPNLSLIRYDEPPAAVAAAIDEGLGQANEAAAPLHEVRPVACAARLGDGTIIGGAVGRTWGLCCELQQLWVHPAHRRRRLGTPLVREFESAAKSRGCLTFIWRRSTFRRRACTRRSATRLPTSTPSILTASSGIAWSARMIQGGFDGSSCPRISAS